MKNFFIYYKYDVASIKIFYMKLYKTKRHDNLTIKYNIMVEYSLNLSLIFNIVYDIVGIPTR